MDKETALIFDIDDTLYDQIYPIVNACEQVIGRELADPMLFYEAFRRRSNEAFYQVESGSLSLAASRICRVKNALMDRGVRISDSQAKLFQECYEQNSTRITLSKTFTDFFEDCSLSGVRMGVLTNGPHEHQMKKFFTLGLDRWISPCMAVVSESAGYSKPDVRIFQYAQRKMGLFAEKTWMVGDSLKNDVGGAIEAGWRTVWFARHAPVQEELSKQPDVKVVTEEELCEKLRQIAEIS